MNTSEYLLAGKLKEKTEEKNALLQCLIVSYTGALSFIEKRDYDAFMQSLENQHQILSDIDDCQGQISSISKQLEEEKNKILALKLPKDENDDLSKTLKSIAKLDIVSQSLLGNSKVLNEKLTYQIKEITKEIKQSLAASKNRKKLKSAYGKNNVSKAGLIMDYKNN